MLNTSKIMILAAALGLGLTAPALAYHHGVRHHRVRHFVPGPRVVVAPVAGPLDQLDLPHPIVREPLEDAESDGYAVGQGPSFLGPDSPGGGIAPPPRGRSFELEAPPIGASLPVVPELYDPDLR